MEEGNIERSEKMRFKIYGNNYLTVDMSDVETKLTWIKSVLNQDQFEKMMYRTFGEVAKRSKTMVAKDVQQDYVVTQQWVKSQIGAYKLQFGGSFPVTCIIPLKGTKGSVGGRFPLKSPVRSRKQGVINSAIVRDHVSTLPQKMEKQGGNPPFVANGVAFTRKTKNRLPIVRVVALGVPQMPFNLSREKVEDSIIQYMEKRLDHHMERLINGKW